MASKSKKRRRVLGASCILAALIIAGSSFAWFTSKDEVTNRLTANADYGVSIVESFAPPKNWIPGQEVNKDVYATNTGSIPSYVKEEVSTVMTVTTVKDTPDLVPGKSVELTEEERYAVEAGAFLAYKPNGSTNVLGNIVVARPEDATDGTKTDFVPTTAGLYVFRRVINVDPTTGKENFVTDGDYNATDLEVTIPASGDEAIAAAKKAQIVGYDGYYFVPGEGGDHTKDKYYKISNLMIKQDYDVIEPTDADAAATNPATATYTHTDYANDGINNDGNLLYAVAGFVEEEQVVLDPMQLKYEKVEDTDVDDTTKVDDKGRTVGQYLVATYDTGNKEHATKYKVAAAAYDKAVHELLYTTELQADALADYSTDNSAYTAAYNAVYDTDTGARDVLATRTNELTTALNNLNDAYDKWQNSKDKSDQAQRDYENSMVKLFGHKDGWIDSQVADNAPASGKYTEHSLYGKYKNSKDALAAVTGSNDNDRFLAEIKAFKGVDYTDLATAVNTLGVEDWEAFKVWVDSHTTGEEHDYYAAYAQNEIDTYNFVTEFNKCIGDFDTTAGTATHNKTNPKDGTYKKIYDSALATTNADYSDYNTTKTDAYNTAKNNYDAAVANYKTKYQTYVDALDTKNASLDKLQEAQAMFNNASARKSAAEITFNTLKDAGSASTLASDGSLEVFIKLSDDVVTTNVTGANDDDNAKWLFKPAPANSGDRVVNDTAEFYYTGILEGGETSSRLIDSVTLSKDVTTDMYKSFDFDINIAMKSAQVTYKDNDTLTADATPQELGAYAALKNNKDVDTPVKWVDANASATWT